MLGKLIGLIVTAILLILGLMFSVVVLVVVSVVGLGVLVYIWWKTRDLRKAMKEHVAAAQATAGMSVDGRVIEGESVRVEEGVPAKQALQIVESQEKRAES